jgi:phosphate transport system substrate-binding protein
MKPLLLLLLLSMCPVVAVAGGAGDAAGGGTRTVDSGRPADVPGDLKGTITLSGAWALYPMAVRWAEEFQKLHPAVHVDIGAGGAGKGMADALAGAVDLGMVSRDIYPPEIEKGAWWVSVAKDAVVPVISSENPVFESLLADGVGADLLRRVWLSGEPVTWGELARASCPHPVRAYTRSDACGAAKTWAAYLGGSQEELRGVGVYGDPGLADAVKRDAVGIGYNNINYVYDAETKRPVPGLAVLPIDLDGDGELTGSERFYSDREAITRAIASGLYPSPPARDLHLVSQGRPRGRLVVEFLRWILTDGQRYVDEAGYIAVADETLREGLDRLGR